MSERQEMTANEWEALGTSLFGEDKTFWKFVCPICKTPQSAEDYKKARIPFEKCAGMIGFSCIGRSLPSRQEGIMNPKKKNGEPCNYAGGGFFQLNPLHITDEDGEVHQLFDFYRQGKNEKD